MMLIVMGIFIWEGYRKGLVWSVFHLTSYFLSLYLTKNYYLKLSEWIYQHTGIVNWITKGVESKFNDIFADYFSSVTAGNPLAGTGWGLIGDYLIKEASVQEYAHSTLETFKSTMVQEFTISILNLLSMILLFFALRLLFTFLNQLLTRVFSLPILNTFNRGGGFLIGGIKGGIIVGVGIMVLFFLAMMSPQGWSAGLLKQSVGAQWVLQLLYPLLA